MCLAATRERERERTSTMLMALNGEYSCDASLSSAFLYLRDSWSAPYIFHTQSTHTFNAHYTSEATSFRNNNAMYTLVSFWEEGKRVQVCPASETCAFAFLGQAESQKSSNRLLSCGKLMWHAINMGEL